MSTQTNKLVKTLSEINPDDLPSFSSSISDSDTSSNSGSFMDFFTGLTWQTWLIIILLLAFLGINIFYYLEKGTETATDIFGRIFTPILKLFGYEVLETTKVTVEESATGTKAGVDVVANTTTGAINAVEKKSRSTTSNSVTGQQSSVNSAEPIRDQLKMEKQINELEDLQQQNLQKALSDAATPAANVQPDDSLSRIQASSGSGKAGWCFIGEDRGFRTCSEIGENDKCMSGDIFPSQEICMNPNLRP